MASETLDLVCKFQAHIALGKYLSSLVAPPIEVHNSYPLLPVPGTLTCVCQARALSLCCGILPSAGGLVLYPHL